jgi:hypothetical protein
VRELRELPVRTSRRPKANPQEMPVQTSRRPEAGPREILKEVKVVLPNWNPFITTAKYGCKFKQKKLTF